MEPGGRGERAGEDGGDALSPFEGGRPDDEGRQPDDEDRQPPQSLPFGAFDVRLDGWDVGYGGELQADVGATPAPDESVDLEVERAADRWTAITPLVTGEPRPLVFVDGVRRLEARVLVRRGDDTCYGAFGSYAVGAVIAEPGAPARFADAASGRRLIYGNGQIPEQPVRLFSALSAAAPPEHAAGNEAAATSRARPFEYLPLGTPDPEPDGPLKALQVAMRQAEATLVRTMPARDSLGRSALTVCDGPLQEIESGGDADAPRRESSAVVGLIKQVFKLYLPLTHRGVLRELRLGQRTPVFCIGADGARARYSWFLRLGTPSAVESDLTGLARLEVSAACGIDAARHLADETTTRLPAFVPSRARDPRWPQNLLPIGALEQHLRHQLGDARLIRRKIAELIAAAPS